MDQKNTNKNEYQLRQKNRMNNSKSNSSGILPKQPNISYAPPVIPFISKIENLNMTRTVEILMSKGKALRIYGNADSDMKKKREEIKLETPEAMLKAIRKNCTQLKSLSIKKKTQGSMFVTELWNDRLYYDIITTSKVKNMLIDLEQSKRTKLKRKMESSDKYFQNKFDKYSQEYPISNSYEIDNSIQKIRESKEVPIYIMEDQEVSIYDDQTNTIIAKCGNLMIDVEAKASCDLPLKKNSSKIQLDREQASASSKTIKKDVLPKLENQTSTSGSSKHIIISEIPSFESNPFNSYGLISTPRSKRIISDDIRSQSHVTEKSIDEKPISSSNNNISKFTEKKRKYNMRTQLSSIFTDSLIENNSSNSPLLSDRTKLLTLQSQKYQQHASLISSSTNKLNSKYFFVNNEKTTSEPNLYHKKDRKMYFLSSSTQVPPDANSTVVVNKNNFSRNEKKSFLLNACKSIDNIIDICEDATDNNSKIFQMIDKELNTSYRKNHAKRLKIDKIKEKYRLEKLSLEIKSKLFSKANDDRNERR